MTVFNINLARSRVLPVNRRRVWYQLLMLYFVIAGFVMVLLAGAVTRNLAGAFDCRRELLHLERQSLQSCPGHKDVAGYVAQTATKMARYADRLEAITGVLSNQSHIAAILLGLALPLSGEMTLNTVDLNRAKGELSFEVWIPESGSVPAVTPPSLVSAWNRAPLLASKVSQITSVGNQHTQLRGQKFSIWRFTGLLPENGD